MLKTIISNNAQKPYEEANRLKFADIEGDSAPACKTVAHNRELEKYNYRLFVQFLFRDCTKMRTTERYYKLSWIRHIFVQQLYKEDKGYFLLFCFCLVLGGKTTLDLGLVKIYYLSTSKF